MSTKKEETGLFEIEQSDSQLTLKFGSRLAAQVFAKMAFHSRLLNSMKPDENSIWVEGERLEVEIKGWPKNISWERESDTVYKGAINELKGFSIDKYKQELQDALVNISIGLPSVTGVAKYSFSIGIGESWKDYSFYGKSREIAALCVLYDLVPHSRNDLEINTTRRIVNILLWPKEIGNPDQIIRFYGDPSKTADVLRNEGWPREGPNTSLKVFMNTLGGIRQQMYQLLSSDQSLESQVMRSTIPDRWKRELFETQGYVCRICHIKYEEEYLAPDHRVPVFFQSDELNDSNYKEKLMTLCRFCNQQKREFCKRIPHDYDWSTSPWAYPEKFELEKIKMEIESYSSTHSKSINEVLKLIDPTD